MNNEPEGQTPSEGSTSTASGEQIPGPGQVQVTEGDESHLEDTPEPQMPLGTATPAVLDDPPVVATGRDHAPDQSGRGIAKNPNPRAPSGLTANQIARVAYNAVQDYKVMIGQVPNPPFEDLLEVEPLKASGIVEQVAMILEGRSVGGASNHELWQKHMKAQGVTFEDDPRVDQPWLGMKPEESRKALLFNQVCVALIRTI